MPRHYESQHFIQHMRGCHFNPLCRLEVYQGLSPLCRSPLMGARSSFPRRGKVRSGPGLQVAPAKPARQREEDLYHTAGSAAGHGEGGIAWATAAYSEQECTPTRMREAST